jgi:cyclic pyranopterin phosphate synthase
MTLRDALGRPLGSLRLSVTDRCNMRCRYCMPEDEYVWLPRASILSFEELTRLARIFGALGAGKIRLTGGEPLLRHGLPDLVRMLAAEPTVEDLALTTNGLLLASQATALRSAGLGRVTVSLDTLRPERMARFARTERHADVVAGIRAAREAGFASVKLNAVILRGFNDDEVLDLLAFAMAEAVELRYIEYMDVGGATRWSMADVVPQQELLERIGERYGPVEAVPPPASPLVGARPPAEQFRLRDGTLFGVIASTTAPFCRSCDRSRITADGTWYRCLYADRGTDLRGPLRQGATDADLLELIGDAWRERDDRGAERRLEAAARGALYPIESLRADPRREMHTRGG